MSPSTRRRSIGARGATGALIAVAFVVVTSSAAAGQSPPPPPPGVPPGSELPPPPPPGEFPPPPAAEPPVGTGGQVEHPDPDPPRTDGPPAVDGPATPAPAGPVAPSRVVELITREAAVHGRRLAVAIRCRDSGSATLRRRNRTLARASFTCADYGATVSFRLRAHDARVLRKRAAIRLTARFRVASESVRHRIVTRASRATLSVASTPAWAMSWVSCGSRFGAYPGLSIDPGNASTHDGRDDYMAYSYWIQTPDLGWTQYGPAGPAAAGQKWSPYYRAPALGGVPIGGQDRFGLRPGSAAWARVVVLKYWYYARHFEYVYPVVDSYLGGFIYPGGWCWWTN